MFSNSYWEPFTDNHVRKWKSDNHKKSGAEFYCALERVWGGGGKGAFFCGLIWKPQSSYQGDNTNKGKEFGMLCKLFSSMKSRERLRAERL